MATRTVLFLITAVSLSRVGCRDKVHRSIEMLLVLPMQGEPPKGELEFITISEINNRALVTIRNVTSENSPRFYKAAAEVSGKQFDKWWSQFEHSGLSGSIRLAAQSPLSLAVC